VGNDGVVHLPGGQGGFAGSSLTMDVAVRNVQAMVGWPEAQAVAACSVRVAEYLGF
jgi:N-acetylglucosamine-6-phosphate deacetylase